MTRTAHWFLGLVALLFLTLAGGQTLAQNTPEPTTAPVGAATTNEGATGHPEALTTGAAIDSAGANRSTHPVGESKETSGNEGHGQEGGGVDVNPLKPDLIVTIIIFGVLLLVLRVTAWKPILQGLKARETAIREGIEAAAKARAEAERTTKELEAKIAEAQRQGAQALTQAKADAQKLAESIRAQAEAEAAAMKDRALRDIEAAKQQALADINGRAADLGTAIARKILQRNVTVEDQQRLVEESLGQLQAHRN